MLGRSERQSLEGVVGHAGFEARQGENPRERIGGILVVIHNQDGGGRGAVLPEAVNMRTGHPDRTVGSLDPINPSGRCRV